MLGIVCALAAEARHLGAATPRREPLASLADGTLLAVSGMGGAAAAASARALIEAGADALVSFGLAGGLDPALGAGSIFLPSEIITLTGPGVHTAHHWRERLGVALAAEHPRVHGKLLSTATAVGSVAQKAALFRDTGAAAVDMESLAVAQVAESGLLPFIAVRVIVDSAQDELPRAVTAAADAPGNYSSGACWLPWHARRRIWRRSCAWPGAIEPPAVRWRPWRAPARWRRTRCHESAGHRRHRLCRLPRSPGRCCAQTGEVRALVRAELRPAQPAAALRLEIVVGDLADRGSLERALDDCEALFHVAADYRLGAREPRSSIAPTSRARATCSRPRAAPASAAWSTPAASPRSACPPTARPGARTHRWRSPT